MKVTLIGFMGSGKSSVGQMLARKLKHNYIEMDFLVLKESGRESITEIFEKDGEAVFRKLETDVARNLQDKDNTIIATGGGIVMNKGTLDYVKSNGTVVFLDTTFRTIEKRLEGDTTRPLFQNKEKAKELYTFRKPLYAQYADITIETNNKIVEKITDEIIHLCHPQSNRESI